MSKKNAIIARRKVRKSKSYITAFMKAWKKYEAAIDVAIGKSQTAGRITFASARVHEKDLKILSNENN